MRVLAPLDQRRALVAQASDNLVEIVYRSLRLENEPITRREVELIIEAGGRMTGQNVISFEHYMENLDDDRVPEAVVHDHEWVRFEDLTDAQRLVWESWELDEQTEACVRCFVPREIRP